jgi:hypothetical protein
MPGGPAEKSDGGCAGAPRDAQYVLSVYPFSIMQSRYF